MVSSAGEVSSAMRHSILGLRPMVCLLLALIVAPVQAALVLNEICYDPPGPDAGFEWVELYNSGLWPVTLEGLTLESGNGSAAGQWREVWEGRPGDWCEAGGVFWIGGPVRGGNPDSPGRLDLQNGPDGVRLLRQGFELDRAGGGDLAFAEDFEGAPAPLVPSGRSLARRIDGADTQSNQADFEEAYPTPGRPNHPLDDLAVRLYRAGRPLPLSGGPSAVEATVRLENHGTRSLDPLRVLLSLEGRTLLPDPTRTLSPIEPGQGIDWPVLIHVAEGSGVQSWSCLGRLEGDPVKENDSDTLRLWAGERPVQLTEIAPRPETGRSEWIELEVRFSGGVNLSGWLIQDHGGAEVRIDSLPPAEAGGVYVLARDREASGGIPAEAFLSWKGEWPSLNDLAGAVGTADSLFLYDPAGHLVDWATYGEAPRGVTWMRVVNAPLGSGLSEWTVSSDPPEGTPGVTNPEVGFQTPEPGAEDVAPRACVMGEGREAMWLRVPGDRLPGPWQLRIVDLNGREVHRTVGLTHDRSDQWTRWDGRDGVGAACPSGLYLVQVEARTEGGGTWAQRQPFVLAR
jgi:hypothetical protein